jgi:hypothetical protein
LPLFRRLPIAGVTVAVVTLAGLAGFFGVVAVVLRERAVQVHRGLYLAVVVAADIALVAGVRLDFFAFVAHGWEEKDYVTYALRCQLVALGVLVAA